MGRFQEGPPQSHRFARGAAAESGISRHNRGMRLIVAISACGLAAAALGQFDDWRVGVGGNSQRYGLSREVGPVRASRLWTAGVGAVIAQQPMVEGGLLVMSRIFDLGNTQGGTDIVAHDLGTGAVLWRTQLPVDGTSDWRSRVTAINRGVVFATRSGNTNRSPLYALRGTDGTIIWRSQGVTDETTSESMAIAPDGDLVTSGGRGLIRINFEDGATVWDTARTYPSSDSGAAAIGNGRVYAWEQTGQGPRVSAFDLGTGVRLYSTAGLSGLTQQATLLVGPDGTVYAPRQQGNPATDYFIALQDTGMALVETWRYPFGGGAFTSYGVGPDGTVYTYSRANPKTVVRLDPATGLVLNESMPIPADFFQGRMAIDAAGRVFLTNGAFSNGAVYSFNPDLSLRWSEPIANVNQGGPTLGRDGTLVVAGVGTDVRAYRDPGERVDPIGFDVTRGVLESGSLGDLLLSDDLRVSIQQRPPFLVSDPNAQIVVHGVAGGTPEVLRFRLEALCTGSPSRSVVQRVELFNFALSRYVVLDERNPALTDQSLSVAVGGNAAQYVGGGGEVRARVSWFDRGTLAPNWAARIDVAAWVLVR